MVLLNQKIEVLYRISKKIIIEIGYIQNAEYLMVFYE